MRICVRQVLDFEAHCVDYEIMRQPVSVHCPLTRFLAGIYLELSRSSISLDSPDLRPVRASALCALRLHTRSVLVSYTRSLRSSCITIDEMHESLCKFMWKNDSCVVAKI